ncbi:hypothetical protein AK36_2150 [Burkholderia vietnamiensis LMG 10929]|nr:hypothetical protein AK36_2150 [Burkholderia vietnamiensis LMG 10929]
MVNVERSDRAELKLSDRETQPQGKHEFPVFGQRWTEMTA